MCRSAARTGRVFALSPASCSCMVTTRLPFRGMRPLYRVDRTLELSSTQAKMDFGLGKALYHGPGKGRTDDSSAQNSFKHLRKQHEYALHSAGTRRLGES